jgi:phage protein D
MALNILQIEQARKNFYAPAFNVATGRTSLVADLALEVTSVQVDNLLDKPDRFSFVIANAFHVSTREFVKIGNQTLPEFFRFGLPIEISMGYGDRAGLDRILSGVVTEISTNFPSSGLPQLTVSGFDHSYCLTKGAQSDNWENSRDSDVVREVARRYSLTPRVEDTRVVHEKIEMSQENPAQFFTRLADRNGFQWFALLDELYFRAPSNDERGVIELEWGRGLVSFSPEIKLSTQVSEVEVYGWNVQAKRQIVGKARRGDEPGRDQSRASGKKRASGAEYLQEVCRDKAATTLRVREPVFSQQQADQRARAILKRRAEGFVGGRGETIGIPELQADTNVTLKGLGDFFSTTFYVTETTHTVNASGYRTTFEVGDTTI